jgi:hypothetical protein
MMRTEAKGAQVRFRILLTLVVLLAGSCSDDAADETTTTTATTTTTLAPSIGPPWGLDAIAMPDTAGAVELWFGALPEEISGAQRTLMAGRVAGGIEAEYLQPAGVLGSVRATPMEGVNSASGGDFSPIDWLGMMSSDVDIEDSDLDPEADFAWFAGRTEADGAPAYIVAWGVPDAGWYFDIVSGTADGREALAAAFIEAAG